MTKPLSEQLADLSVRAKKTEDAFAQAQKEAHDKVTARRDKAHADAVAATARVSEQIQSVNDTASRNWSATKAKVAADVQKLKNDVSQHQHDRDVRRAEKRADDLEWDASFAVDYAIASVEQANVAILDAIEARVEAVELAQDAA